MRILVATILVFAGMAVPGGCPAAWTRSDDEERLEYKGHLQAADQSDYDFARSCVEPDSNSKAINDREYEREEARIRQKYHRDLERVFDFIAEKRKDPLRAFDLKIQFQEAVQEEWEDVVQKTEALLESVADSDYETDKGSARVYRAALARTKNQLEATKRKIKTLRSDRKELERKLKKK